MPIDTIKTDQDIVQETLKNKQVFSEIIHRYEEPLRRYVRRLGGESRDVEDVLQEIFIKVFINLNDYDPNLKFSSWIYRIAHNETISFFRKKNIRPGVLTLNTEDTDAFFECLVDESDFVELASKRDDLRMLNDLLSKIDQKYREVLTLRFLEEKSYDEISDILKIPEGTVATFISRGKRELKKLLESRGIKNI